MKGRGGVWEGIRKVQGVGVGKREGQKGREIRDG